MRRAYTVSISIDRAWGEVYAFLADPLNYPQWGAIDPDTFRQRSDGSWEAETQFGFRHVRFTPENGLGVVDMTIVDVGGEASLVPMRVVPNGDGSEVTLMFFPRDEMDENQVASMREWITTDLQVLKSLMETAVPR